MKKITTLIMALLPVIAMAQIKPGLPKAQKLLMEGKFIEAKEQIDATIASTEFMQNKKGQPSGKAPEAYYLKGMIYMSLDTTSDPKFAAEKAGAFETAVASFKKAEELDPKSGSFIKDPKSYLPLTIMQVSNTYIGHYQTKALNSYNKEKDFKAAFAYAEKAVALEPATPPDTAMLSLVGIYMAPSAEEYDKALVYLDRYIAAGGTNAYAWLQKVSITLDKKKDNVAGLKAIQEAEAKFPNNEDYPKYELNIYLQAKDYAKARTFVAKSIKRNPKDPASQFMLGQLYDRTGSPDSARIQYEKTVQMDPTNFDANMELARSYYAEGRKIKAQRDKLGISASDIAQRKVLLDKQRGEYKIALPYWEKCEKLKPEDSDVLYTLDDIYSSLVMEDQQARVEKKIKALGLDK